MAKVKSLSALKGTAMMVCFLGPCSTNLIVTVQGACSMGTRTVVPCGPSANCPLVSSARSIQTDFQPNTLLRRFAIGSLLGEVYIYNRSRDWNPVQIFSWIETV